MINLQPPRLTRARRLSPRRCRGALLLLLAAVSPAGAQGGIMVAPTRMTLDSEQRTGEVFVVNRGNEPITARISLVNRHMREDGSFAEATAPEPGERFADRFLQYAPRRVHLEPGQGQTVRVLARLPADQPPAEYRSHLMFRVEPSMPAESSPRNGRAAGNSRALGIRLVPIYGLTIPVIVRTGALSAASTIDGLSVQTHRGQPPSVTFRLHRTGNRSIYGDVRLLFQPLGGTERLVGTALGLAVYTPLPMRTVSAPMNRLQGDSLPPGRLRVQLVDHGDNSRVLAEAERMVP